MENEKQSHIEEPIIDPNDFLIGKVVASRYRVLSKLGEGGMGLVYLAEHVTIEKKVALKVLLHEYASKAELKDRFLQEAKAAAKIGHENIVDITDFGETPDNSVFFAMEFLEGQDLAKAIRKNGPIPWTRAKPILLQICRALGAAHSKGIIHRDMKPENIYLVEREGRSDFVKVLDFGIAKMSMEQQEKRLTRTGMIFGTPEYMSPEQAQGNPPDHRVDIYSVGVIMYEMLTGSVPFKADTFMGILTKHLFENPKPPTQANPEVLIPTEVEIIVLKAMMKDREERFQSMTEMAAAITQASGRMTRPTGDSASFIAPRRIPGGLQGGPSITSARGTLEVEEIRDDDGCEQLTFAGPPSKKLLIAIGGIAVLVIIAGAFFLMRSSTNSGVSSTGQSNKEIQVKQPNPSKSNDESKKEQFVIIVVKTEPMGVSIYAGDFEIGKQALGVTPAEIKLPKTSKGMLLTLHLDGYQDLRHHIVPDKNMDLFLQLQKKEPLPQDKNMAPSDNEKKQGSIVKKKGGNEKTKHKKPKEASTPSKIVKPKNNVRSNDLMNPFD